jgi:hypothetical protein
MTRNRKADLQRKLAMAPVAKPPAGLADRIKSDIPQRLGFEPERTQLRKSAMFNLRIAASIILLVSSLYLALRLVSRSEMNMSSKMASAPKSDSAPAPRAAIALPNTPPEPGSARVQERADLPALPRVPPPTSIAARPAPARIAEAKREEAVGMSGGAASYVDTIQEVQPMTQSTAVVNIAPAAPAQSPPAAAVEQPAPLVTAESGSAARERTFAKSSAAAPPAESRDAAAQPAVRNFFAIQQAISRGEAPREMDVYAIVQHFAAPERAPADLHVELEASAMPLDATKWLLRVSVDAPGTTSAPIDLAFGDALTAHRQLAGSVAPNQTALYEIEFKPGAKRDETIATIHAGNARSMVRVADLNKWEKASPRMKRASLAAAWARAPKSRTQTEAIVAMAREAHIDELADIAEQAERIR